ncbi:MAG TPA: 16S rRNA (cytidine(1402)-2'-O)-methyltransferase [Rhizomicrobium sp.]
MSNATPTEPPSPSPLEPGLYVTATPIGNARDVTLRALDVLSRCDAIAAEDTRTTARLLAIHAVSRPLLSYSEHSAARTRPMILRRLAQGARIALVSDAGTPLISDPGYKLVSEALAAGIAVHPVPGASAALAGLVVSGLPTDRFFFAGFLPAASAARRTALAELKPVRATLVFFEAPQRLAESLRDMSEVLGARHAAVAREITKLHEEVRRDTLENLAKRYDEAGAPRGEVTVIVNFAPPDGPDLGRADLLLESALEFMPVRAASDLVANALNISRRAVYARALARKKDTGQ